MQVEQLRQMLGGEADPGSASPDASGGSTPFNPGPWQEPSSLTAPGPQRTEALQQLAQLVILEQARGIKPDSLRVPCTSQVHTIFRSFGLPHVMDLHERRGEQGGRFPVKTYQKLYQRWCAGSQGSEVEAYLAWLQSGFLHIITTSLQQQHSELDTPD
jgi:hypothetical protein